MKDVESSIEKYKYNTETYMTDVMKIDKSYVDKVFKFYHDCILDYTLSTDSENITPYRKKLISLCKNEFKINQEGAIYNEQSDRLHPTGFFKTDFNQPVDGMLIYMCLQYEEDSLIDEYDSKYDFDKFPRSELAKDIYNIKPRKFKKFADTFESKNSHAPSNSKGSIDYIEFKIKECLFDYISGDEKYYIILSEWNDYKVPLKISINVYNPTIDIIDQKIKNKTTSIRIIKNNAPTCFSTLRGSKLFKLTKGSWVFS